jgi:hypothetical protein
MTGGLLIGLQVLCFMTGMTTDSRTIDLCTSSPKQDCARMQPPRMLRIVKLYCDRCIKYHLVIYLARLLSTSTSKEILCYMER